MITDIVAILKIYGELYNLEYQGKILDKSTKEDIEFIIKNDFNNESFEGVDQVVDVIWEKLGIALNYRRIK